MPEESIESKIISIILTIKILNAYFTEIVIEAEALLGVQTTYSNGYAASVCQQLRALLRRGFIGVLRDVHLTQVRFSSNHLQNWFYLRCHST